MVNDWYTSRDEHEQRREEATGKPVKILQIEKVGKPLETTGKRVQTL